MNTGTILLLKVVIALALAGSLVVQVMIVPAVWRDLEGEELWGRITLVSIATLGILTMQVFAVCVWMLLTRVRRGSIFHLSSFRYVDVIVGTISAAAVLAFALAALLAPGEVAPGMVGLIGGAGLVLAGFALLVVVMKALLRQAIEREDEARTLRDELGEVI
ncbi:DUF2975 domain-containing protein [Microbacterium sp. Re1]|uniref:DUF2975 domain-containing protein n=1 Tax=Microbacterium commune TaxID=2762219 RepID=A0ABR8W3N8_9MICO|nr:DUF2975 domain-containing protein [Microbacterium commune]MBD8011644.1 DUF2975 domain-containing protein [Microbacterium commune]